MAYKFVLTAKKDQKLYNSPIGRIKLGMVSFHKELVDFNTERCCGGGSYRIDNKNKIIELYDESVDFGLPQFNAIDWKYIEADEDFQDYKITYRFPYTHSTESNKIIDVKPLMKFCL